MNVNTIRAAYSKLESAGLVATEQGRGTFVTAGARPTPPPADRTDEAARRRRLHDDIVRLEAELVSLPLAPGGGGAVDDPGSGGPRVLSVEELTRVRDLLSERVRELRDARAAIVERRGAPSSPEPDRPRPAAGARRAARRSSSSLAGARVRWTGA